MEPVDLQGLQLILDQSLLLLKRESIINFQKATKHYQLQPLLPLSTIKKSIRKRFANFFVLGRFYPRGIMIPTVFLLPEKGPIFILFFVSSSVKVVIIPDIFHDPCHEHMMSEAKRTF